MDKRRAEPLHRHHRRGGAATVARGSTETVGEFADSLRTEWPLEDMRGADLIAAARRRIETKLGLPTKLEAVDESIWLKVDSYSLMQADHLSREPAARGVRHPRGPLRARARGPARASRPHLDRRAAGLRDHDGVADRLDGAGRRGVPADVEADHRAAQRRDLVPDRQAIAARILPHRDPGDPAGGVGVERAAGRGEPAGVLRFRPVPSAGADAGAGQPAARGAELHGVRHRDDGPAALRLATRSFPSAPCASSMAGCWSTRCSSSWSIRGRAMSPEASRITGIETSMLEDQPTIDQVLPAFRQFCEDTVLVAHNAAFDMRFLRLKEEATGVRFTQPVLDTLLLSAVIHPDLDAHRLEAIAERMGVNPIGRHTALGDAIMTAEVFLRMIPLLAEQGIRTLGRGAGGFAKDLFRPHRILSARTPPSRPTTMWLRNAPRRTHNPPQRRKVRRLASDAPAALDGRRHDSRNAGPYQGIQGIRRGQGREPVRSPRQHPRADRPQRRRQDDVLQPPHAFPYAHARPDLLQRQRNHGLAAGGHRAHGPRALVPDLRGVPAPHRPRERAHRVAAQAGAFAGLLALRCRSSRSSTARAARTHRSRGPDRIHEYHGGGVGLRPQARAGDRDDAGARPRDDAAGRADGGHDARGRRADRRADQEGGGQPHRADGRAQPVGRLDALGPHHRAGAGRDPRRRATTRRYRSIPKSCRRTLEPDMPEAAVAADRRRAQPRARRSSPCAACRRGTANRTSCTASTSTSRRARWSRCSAATARARPRR